MPPPVQRSRADHRRVTGTSPAHPIHPPPEPAPAERWPAVGPRTHTFAGTEASVGLARRILRQDLEGYVADIDDGLVLVSEAVTNAIQHSRSKLYGTVDMTVTVMCARVRVEVADAGPLNGGRPVMLDSTGERGRGLRIIAELADRWGWAPRHTRGGGCGTVVWFELPRKGA